jgi:hypothetical protein
MKFKVISFELVPGAENLESGKDFVRVNFKQEYDGVEVIDLPPSTAQLLLSAKDQRIPGLVKMIHTGKLIENPFAESE